MPDSAGAELGASRDGAADAPPVSEDEDAPSPSPSPDSASDSADAGADAEQPDDAPPDASVTDSKHALCDAVCRHAEQCDSMILGSYEQCELMCNETRFPFAPELILAVLRCVRAAPCERLSRPIFVECTDTVAYIPPARFLTCLELSSAMADCEFSDADASTATWFCHMAAADWTAFSGVEACAGLDWAPAPIPPNPPPISPECAALEQCLEGALGLGAVLGEWGSGP